MRMRTAFLALIGILVVASSGGGQSLAEVAKKEKKRRDANSKPVVVVDDEALKRAGAGPSTESTVVTGASGTEGRSARQGDDGTGDSAPTSSNPTTSSTSARDCRAELSAMRDRKNALQQQYAKGLAWLEDMPRVRRSANPGYERAPMGFYRQTISMTCEQLSGERARYRSQYKTCQDLERQIKELERDIDRKVIACEKRR